jgi:predicted flap endonuclease-1-like 5' DNA nuclease
VLILSTVILIALAAFAGYYFGAHRTPPAREDAPARLQESLPAPVAPTIVPAVAAREDELASERERIGEEKARIIRSLERETAMLRARRDDAPGSVTLDGTAQAALAAELAVARAETARYRQLVIDIENNAPPPILQGAAEPDDLKLIVGVGPVLERMLRNLGIHNFRQIARWSAQDVAEFDARLPEFPGRIVRDQWVTQARALHESKYGESALGKGT